MKKISIISLFALVALVISSCGSSNNVVSNHGISKRKYTKGFFFQRNSNIKTADSKVKDAELKEDKSIAKVEKTEARKAKKATLKNNNVKSTLYAPSENADVANLYVPEDNMQVPQNGDAHHDRFDDGINWSVTENQPSATGESIKPMRAENRANTAKKSSGNAAGSVGIVVLVILAIIIPPLAVFLYEGVTQRFWIDLIMALIGYGVGFALLGGIGGLLGLIAIIYALLIVLEVI